MIILITDPPTCTDTYICIETHTPLYMHESLITYFSFSKVNKSFFISQVLPVLEKGKIIHNHYLNMLLMT